MGKEEKLDESIFRNFTSQADYYLGAFDLPQNTLHKTHYIACQEKVVGATDEFHSQAKMPVRSQGCQTEPDMPTMLGFSMVACH